MINKIKDEVITEEEVITPEKTEEVVVEEPVEEEVVEEVVEEEEKVEAFKDLDMLCEVLDMIYDVDQLQNVISALKTNKLDELKQSLLSSLKNKVKNVVSKSNNSIFSIEPKKINNKTENTQKSFFTQFYK